MSRSITVRLLLTGLPAVAAVLLAVFSYTSASFLLRSFLGLLFLLLGLLLVFNLVSVLAGWRRHRWYTLIPLAVSIVAFPALEYGNHIGQRRGVDYLRDHIAGYQSVLDTLRSSSGSPADGYVLIKDDGCSKKYQLPEAYRYLAPCGVVFSRGTNDAPTVARFIRTRTPGFLGNGYMFRSDGDFESELGGSGKFWPLSSSPHWCMFHGGRPSR